jgi:HAD superfamily hydrolase (TIGR01509 family)
MRLPPDAAAIAWDIDGTLIDSEPLHHRALVAASRGFGSDLSDLPDMAFRGVHMLDVWEILRPRLPSGLERDAWLAAIEVAYVRDATTLVPMPGARETVATLAARGLRQVAVSNSSRAVVDANIAALGIGAWLEFSISLDDITRGKPDPEPYALAAQRMGLPPSRVWAVEDSATGLASARAAGLGTIALRTEAALGDHADLTIDALDQIAK